MKRQLVFSFIAVIIFLFLMRWQGRELITPVSPNGIVDLEFAKTPLRFIYLSLFMKTGAILQNLYLDFLFMASYVWFFIAALQYCNSQTGWLKISGIFIGISWAAGVLDFLENLMLILIINEHLAVRFIRLVYYLALCKFIFAGLVILFLLASLPFLLRRKPAAMLFC
jgi:hypothetical protein